MKKKEPRKVTITSTDKVHAVEYVERSKGRHYWAASFDRRYFDVEYVKGWIATKPNLELATEHSIQISLTPPG